MTTEYNNTSSDFNDINIEKIINYDLDENVLWDLYNNLAVNCCGYSSVENFLNERGLWNASVDETLVLLAREFGKLTIAIDNHFENRTDKPE